MIELVVWGVGERGRRLKKLIGDKIIAFIDQDYQSISSFEGIPVISFTDYIEKYYCCPIIVSPLINQTILKFVMSYPDIPVINMTEEPSEIFLGEKLPFDKIHFISFVNNETLYLYGINLFSLILYDHLQKQGINRVVFLQGKRGITGKQARVLGLNVAESVSSKSIILCTEKNIEFASCTYPSNRIEDFWNLAVQMKNYRCPELLQFRNKYQGKKRRLFIVATGPSLRIDDLDRLYDRRELTMSVNMVYRCFGMTKWRPDYYIFEDVNGLKEYEEEVRNLDLPNIFLPDLGISRWSSSLLKKNMHIYHLIIDRTNGWPRFSMEISDYISGGRTVVYSCIQVAAYMGIEEIYLIGADCNYQGYAQSGRNHFVPNYCRQGDMQPRMQFPTTEALVSYQAARHFAEERGIKIYNATRGGKLEVFERVHLDSLF